MNEIKITAPADLEQERIDREQGKCIYESIQIAFSAIRDSQQAKDPSC